MELTADHLDGDEPRRLKLNWSAILIGGLPLFALFIYLMVDGEALLSTPEPVAAAEYYPPVAVVFSISGSEDRSVVMEADVRAERRVSLRAETESIVEVMAVRVGDRVASGQQICRMRPLAGGDAVILFSPINGIVNSVGGATGSTVAAGQSCATVIDPSSLIAVAELQPRYAEIITPGNRVMFTIGELKHESSMRVIYPSEDEKGLTNRPFEVAVPTSASLAPGQKVSISIETDQIIPMLVPFRTLMLDPELGMAVRIVHGDGPTGLIETMPVTLVATSKDGFYVEGLPANARLVVQNSEFEQPAEGELVRIGSVG